MFTDPETKEWREFPNRKPHNLTLNLIQFLFPSAPDRCAIVGVSVGGGGERLPSVGTA